MRQTQIKTYLKLGILLFGISLVMVNCQKVEFDENQIIEKWANSEWEINKRTFNEIEQTEKFKLVFDEITKNNKEISSEFSKTVMEEQYGFTIDSSNINEITSNTYTSYTLLIHRDSVSSSSFENLVIIIDSISEPRAYIIRYHLNSEMVYIPADNVYTLDAETELTEIVYNNAQSKVSYIHGDGCTIVTLMCPYLFDHPAGPNCIDERVEDLYLDHDSSNCGITSGPGGGPPGGVGPPSGGNGPVSGGGGINETDPIITVPTPPCEMAASNCISDFDPIHEKNCEELGKLMNNPATVAPQNNPNINGDHKSTRIAILNCASQLGSNFEYGYGFYNKNNFPQYGPYAHNIPAAEDNHVHFPGNSVQYGTVHSHPDNGVRIPMFSHDDLYSLLQIKNQYGIGSLTPDFSDAIFVSVLVVSQGNQSHTYAIKIEDATKLLNLNNYKTTDRDWEGFADEIREAYNDDANGVNGSASDYQKTFLNLVKDLGLGISLYKMKPNDLSNPSELETWEKLSLNSNGTLANPKPCN